MRRYISNKFWIALTGTVLLIAVALTFAIGRMPAKQARVYQNGVLIETIILSEVNEPYSFTVNCDSGTNIISVERGRVCISDADCHDGYCVRQGWISGGAAPIVCLPHGLVIALYGGSGAERTQEKSGDTDVDAVVG